MTNVRREYFESSIGMEFFDLMVGKKIDEGSSRHVYVSAQNENHVIKFEVGNKSFQNVLEWEVWQDAQGRRPAKWLAPCIDISPCGSILIMQRAAPITGLDQLPKRIPSWIGDIKAENWGLIDAKPVLIDYGYAHDFIKLGGRMRNVKWPNKAYDGKNSVG